MRTERTALDEDAFGALAFFTFAGLVLGEDDLVVPRFERAERIVVFVEDEVVETLFHGFCRLCIGDKRIFTAYAIVSLQWILDTLENR